MVAKNSWVRRFSFPSSRSCATSNHRASRSSTLLLALIIAVLETCTLNACEYFRNARCQAVALFDASFEITDLDALPVAGDLHVGVIGGAICTQQCRHALTYGLGPRDRLS